MSQACKKISCEVSCSPSRKTKAVVHMLKLLPLLQQACFGRTGGDLKDALGNDPVGEFGWYGKGGSILMDVARGLHFLHCNKVAHRHGVYLASISIQKPSCIIWQGPVSPPKLDLFGYPAPMAKDPALKMSRGSRTPQEGKKKAKTSSHELELVVKACSCIAS